MKITASYRALELLYRGKKLSLVNHEHFNTGAKEKKTPLQILNNWLSVPKCVSGLGQAATVSTLRCAGTNPVTI